MTETPDLKRIRACAPLLPDPGPEVVAELCDYAERLREALARHHGAYVHGETIDGCADCALLSVEVEKDCRCGHSHAEHQYVQPKGFDGCCRCGCAAYASVGGMGDDL